MFFLVLPNLVCIVCIPFIFFLLASYHKIPLYPLKKLSFFFRKPSLYNSKFLPSSLNRISTLFFLLPLFRPSSSKHGLNLQFFQNPIMLNPYLPKHFFIFQTTTFLSLSFSYSPCHSTISRIGSLVSFPSKCAFFPKKK